MTIISIRRKWRRKKNKKIQKCTKR